MTTLALQPETLTLFEARPQTDYEISPSGIWVAAASYLTWATLAILTYFYGDQLGAIFPMIMGSLGLLGLLFSVLTSYLVFHVLNRRNVHFAREEALLSRTLADLKSKTSPGDMKTQLPLASAEQNLGRLSETKEHSAVLWALLTIVPYAGWVFLTIALAFASHDFSRHEQQESMIMEDLDRVLRSRGSQGLPTRLGKIPKQPVILFIVLSLVTLGIFPIVWLYLVIEDPRGHFDYHGTAETYLVPKPDSATMPGGVI